MKTLPANVSVNSLDIAMGILLTFFAIFISDIARAADDLSEQYQHSVPLPQAESKIFDKLFLIPEGTFQGLKKVYVEHANVNFSRQWERDHRIEVSNGYKEKIRNSYGELLQSELRRALSANDNYIVVENIGDAELVIMPTLANLNIYAPETVQLSRTFTQRAGNATLHISLIDAVNNSPLARIIDHRETRDNVTSRFERANNATNYHSFKRLMRSWSGKLTEQLAALSVVQG